MTEQPPSAIGTVAQEAARLIEDMAAMARLSYSPAEGTGRSAADWAHEPPAADSTRVAGSAGLAEDDWSAGFATGDAPPAYLCGECGADRRHTPGDPGDGGAAASGDAPGSGTSQNCRLCPLCRGIAMLRSVRPETVDLLADLATSVAASLRDVARRSRASDPKPSGGSSSGAPPDAGRAPVQDIPVDDESEG